MKQVSTLLVLIAAIALLVYTNPSLDSYSSYVRQRLMAGSAQQDAITRGLSAAFGGVAVYYIRNASTRDNYVLFSVFHTHLNDRPIHCIGALDNFFACKNLDPAAPDRG